MDRYPWPETAEDRKAYMEATAERPETRGPSEPVRLDPLLALRSIIGTRDAAHRATIATLVACIRVHVYQHCGARLLADAACELCRPLVRAADQAEKDHLPL